MNKIWEACGYLGIALTVAGQVLIGGDYLLGQGCWLAANGLYILKAVKQDAGKAEITRNVIMSALTAGLMIYWIMWNALRGVSHFCGNLQTAASHHQSFSSWCGEIATARREKSTVYRETLDICVAFL